MPLDPTLQNTILLEIEQALHQAVSHHQAGQLQEAEGHYLALLRIQPNHPEANHNMGMLAMLDQRPADSLPYFTAALDADPAHGPTWLNYIEALYQTDQLDDARQILELVRAQGLQGEEVEALAFRLKVSAITVQSEVMPMAADCLPGSSTASTNYPRKPRIEDIETLVALFTNGRYNEAATQAQLMTLDFPLHEFGWKALGAVYKQMGRTDEALQSMQKSAAMSPDDVEANYNLGVILQELGRLTEAEDFYRRALKISPAYAEAHCNLGSTLREQKRGMEAEACLRRAIQIKPDFAEAHCNLGITLLEQGRLIDAETCLRRALQNNPNIAKTHNSMGYTLMAQGKLTDAAISYREAININPNFADAHDNLGDTLMKLDRPDEAEISYRRALQLNPDNAETHCNLGTLFLNRGRREDAMHCYRQALQIKPDLAEAHSNLGACLHKQGLLTEAEASYRCALKISPAYTEVHSNLGVTLHDLGRLTDAESSLRHALLIDPDYAEAHSNLGNTLKELCRLDEAETSYRRALQLKPNYKNAFSNLLFTQNYHPDKSARDIFEIYREYDLKFGQPYRNEWRPHDNSRETDRRLKVGYVSPDFKMHSVRHFLEPLLAQHDKEIIEVYAYAELGREDTTTDAYKNYAAHWIPTRGLSDEELADHIRADKIDILVDLAGHSAKNRLGVFARKPAPVSVSWLGYGYTTGLSAIDYYLTDEACVPIGSEELFSEKPWRIAPPAYCYRPDVRMGEISELPARQSGYITFGTLTRSVRINHRTIRVWSEILKRVKNSRLLIDSASFKEHAIQDQLAEKFAAHGISRDQLDIGYHSPPWDTLRGIDIGLDCFPHNSGTTLFETLYMGIPFVTLADRPSVGRLGSSILQGAGHTEWIAGTENEYVQKAVALAENLPALAELRAGLRQNMQRGMLMNEADFARKIEAAYREMFKKWANE